VRDDGKRERPARRAAGVFRQPQREHILTCFSKERKPRYKILPLHNILPNALQALDDFDFLDNFLAEMEEEKKTKSPVVGGAPKTLGPPKPAPTRTSSARPSTRADAFLSELEDMVNEKRTFPHNYLFIHRYSDDYFFKI